MDSTDILLAADTARMQGGGKSMWDQLGDAATAGAAGATMSALAGFYNSAVAFPNLFGANIEQMDTAKALGNINRNWQSYYEQNQDVVDTVGFIGGSLVPGALALKGLRAYQAGKSYGTFRSLLNYTKEQEAYYLEKGLQEIATKGGTVFSRLNSAKLAGMAFGAADSVIENAVMGTAVALTMHASPLLADESWRDIAWDTMKWSLFGGALTGAIRIIPVNRMYKDAGKLVEESQRKYDSVTPFSKGDVDIGDKTLDLIDQALSLPLEVLQSDKALAFNMRTASGVKAIQLNTGALFDRKLTETTQKTLDTIQAGITQLVAKDTTVSAPLAQALVNTIKEGMKQGADIPAIRQALYNKLAGLDTVQSVGSAPLHFGSDVFYLSPKATLTAGESVVSKFSPKRGAADDIGYRLVGNLDEATSTALGKEFTTLKDAFAANYDLVISGPEGKFHINPDSKIFQKITGDPETQKLRQVFNTRTLAITDNAMPTAADMGTALKSFERTDFGVKAGERVFAMSVNNYNPAADSVEITARHAWASKLEKLPEKNLVSSYDFSLLSRAVENEDVLLSLRIAMPDGTVKEAGDITFFDGWLTTQKLEFVKQATNAQKMAAEKLLAALAAGETITPAMRRAAEEIDPRLLAYKVNSEVSWIEKLTATDFHPKNLKERDATRRLSTYLEKEQIVMVYSDAIRGAMAEGDFITTQLAHHYRMDIAKQKWMEASNLVLREAADNFLDLPELATSAKFNATGVGAHSFTASNANYGDIAYQWAQYSGTQTAKLMGKRADEAAQTLQVPSIPILADPLAAAELVAVTTKGRRTPGTEMQFTLHEGAMVDLKSWERGDGTFEFYKKLNPKVYEFLRTHHMDLHQRQFKELAALKNASGVTVPWSPNALYFPPIDPKRVPYFAFVREADKKVFGTSSVGMITARTPEELDDLISKVSTEYQVIRKSDSELYHKAIGDYERDRTMNSGLLDPFQGRRGKLSDFMPTMEPKAIVEDFLVYHINRENQLVRDAVELRYQETFNKLRWLSEDAKSSQTSKTEYVGKISAKSITDPYGDYLKTALNISKKAEYVLWHQMNEFVDSVGTRAYRATEKAFQEARGGKITWEQANEAMTKMGLGGPFTEENFIASQVGRDRQLVARGVRMGNMLLSVVGLGLDVANSMVNVISMPILLGTEVQAIKSALGKADPLNGKLNELMSVVDPASGLAVPSTTKLLANAIKSYWQPEKVANLERYKSIGAVTTILDQHRSMMADLTITPNLAGAAWAKKVEAAVEKGTHLTGNKFAEQFTRYVSANVMQQITDPLVTAGKMTAKEQNAYISIFVNRVQGNYTASQRPIIFQGTLGAALGLFQTYQFNMFQQLFRHIENRDARSVAVLAGLQSSIFGLNGLPMFNAINTQLIGQASINEGHEDAFTFAVRAGEAIAGKPGVSAADWLMYGTASAFPIFSDKMPALYTRGDINPRHPTIIPISPTQVPLYEVGSRVIGNIIDTAKRIGRGDDIIPTLLMGLEHNSVSRPLAGMAQVLQGYSTTGAGGLIGAHSDMLSIATASRIIGARPMDEALLLETRYRLDGYRAADRDRLETLGTDVKIKMRNGSLTEDDMLDLQTRYAAAGGRLENYGATLQRWRRGAHTSVINVDARSLSTSHGKHLNLIMGGDHELENLEPPGSQ